MTLEQSHDNDLKSANDFFHVLIDNYRPDIPSTFEELINQLNNTDFELVNDLRELESGKYFRTQTGNITWFATDSGFLIIEPDVWGKRFTFTDGTLMDHLHRKESLQILSFSVQEDTGAIIRYSTQSRFQLDHNKLNARLIKEYIADSVYASVYILFDEGIVGKLSKMEIVQSGSNYFVTLEKIIKESHRDDTGTAIRTLYSVGLEDNQPRPEDIFKKAYKNLKKQNPSQLVSKSTVELGVMTKFTKGPIFSTSYSDTVVDLSIPVADISFGDVLEMDTIHEKLGLASIKMNWPGQGKITFQPHSFSSSKFIADDAGNLISKDRITSTSGVQFELTITMDDSLFIKSVNIVELGNQN